VSDHVYVIWNRASECLYVGYTACPADRIAAHRSKFWGSSIGSVSIFDCPSRRSALALENHLQELLAPRYATSPSERREAASTAQTKARATRRAHATGLDCGRPLCIDCGRLPRPAIERRLRDRCRDTPENRTAGNVFPLKPNARFRRNYHGLAADWRSFVVSDGESSSVVEARNANHARAILEVQRGGPLRNLEIRVAS
jgi:predicted GIY-YIG superfamily endonuclease